MPQVIIHPQTLETPADYAWIGEECQFCRADADGNHLFMVCCSECQQKLCIECEEDIALNGCDHCEICLQIIEENE